jgi:hypothetical protein
VNPPETNAPVWVTPFPYQRNINYLLASAYPTIPFYEGTDDGVLFPSDYYEIIGDEIIQDPVNGIGFDNTGGGFVRYGTVVFHIDNWDRDIPYIKHIWKEITFVKTAGAEITELLQYPVGYRHWGGLIIDEIDLQDYWYTIKQNPEYEEIVFEFVIPPDEIAWLTGVHIATECVLDCWKEGDPALYVDFGEDTRDVIHGETVCWTIGPANFGFVSATCPDPDTFCVDVVETAGWLCSADPPLGECTILDPGYLWWQEICICVPCDAQTCEYDTIIATMAYCYWCGDDTLFCAPECGDCENPNWYGGNPYYSSDTVIVHVIDPPPALVIEQPDSTNVGAGQTAAYIPFQICNADPCALPTDYGYCITSVGSVNIPAIVQCDTITVSGGECAAIYGVIDAGTALECEYDTLTIIAWTIVPPIIYETCWQWIHVVEEEVPLFTTPVVTILVLAMILAAAVFMKRRAASRA